VHDFLDAVLVFCMNLVVVYMAEGRGPGTTRPKDFLKILGQANCQAIVADHFARNCTVEEGTGCHLWTGTTNAGYPLITVGRGYLLPEFADLQNRSFGLHKIALCARTGMEVLGTTSHRCRDRKNCFNGEHLRDEDQETNRSRNYCVGKVICSVHGDVIIDLCSHDGECINIPPTYALCCEAQRSNQNPVLDSSQNPRERLGRLRTPVEARMMTQEEAEATPHTGDTGVEDVLMDLGASSSHLGADSEAGEVVNLAGDSTRMFERSGGVAPSSPIRDRSMGGTSSAPNSDQVERVMDSSPPLHLRQRHVQLPNTQAVRAAEYFEEDEAEFSQYRRRASQTRRELEDVEDSSSFRGPG
jgi:Zinc-binding loop region of homing endonuclease